MAFIVPLWMLATALLLIAAVTLMIQKKGGWDWLLFMAFLFGSGAEVTHGVAVESQQKKETSMNLAQQSRKRTKEARERNAAKQERENQDQAKRIHRAEIKGRVAGAVLFEEFMQKISEAEQRGKHSVRVAGYSYDIDDNSEHQAFVVARSKEAQKLLQNGGYVVTEEVSGPHHTPADDGYPSSDKTYCTLSISW